MEKIFVEVHHTYCVNQDGILFNANTEKIITPRKDNNGKPYVVLHGWNKLYVDEIVWDAFRKERKKDAPIEHINGDVTDCSLVNLTAPKSVPTLKKMIRCTCMGEHSPRVVYAKSKIGAAHLTGCKTQHIDKGLLGITITAKNGKDWSFEWVVFRCNIDGEIRINDFDDDDLCL